jgi:hypothetical protein
VQTLAVRFTLALVTVAMAMFALAFMLNLLNISSLAGLLAYIGMITLLCAFSLFLAAGLNLIALRAFINVKNYFSLNRRLERKLLFNLNRWDRLNRGLYFKKVKIAYDNRLKRVSLSEKSSLKSPLPFKSGYQGVKHPKTLLEKTVQLNRYRD